MSTLTFPWAEMVLAEYEDPAGRSGLLPSYRSRRLHRPFSRAPATAEHFPVGGAGPIGDRFQNVRMPGRSEESGFRRFEAPLSGLILRSGSARPWECSSTKDN